jgi:hypothetical protein
VPYPCEHVYTLNIVQCHKLNRTGTLYLGSIHLSLYSANHTSDPASTLLHVRSLVNFSRCAPLDCTPSREVLRRARGDVCTDITATVTVSE